jgi:hypothetical protein
MGQPIILTPLGGAPYSIVSAHLLHFFAGAWVVDVEISADSYQALGMPSGKVVLVLGGVPMSGTIDPAASGTFGPTARARIVGGAGGWATEVPAQDWHFDNGVFSTTVYQATAAVVGETVADLEPQFFNIDFVRPKGPASSVFRDFAWYVDTAGLTNVGPRAPGTQDPSLVIREYDPVTQRVTFSCDTLLVPGTTLLDLRFNGATPTIFDVEQVFDGRGSIGWAWSGPKAESQLAGDLKSAVLYWTRAALLRMYRYRLINYQGPGPGGGPSRMALQACTPTAGVPNILPIMPSSGVAGAVAMLAPSQEVLVIFENADPTVPRVIGYSLANGLPLTATYDAQTLLALGPTAPAVQIAGGIVPVALATPLTTFMDALKTWSVAVSGALSAAAFPIAAPQTALVAAIAAAKLATPAKKTTAA